MNLLSSLLLILLFFRVQFGKPAENYFTMKGLWHPGEASKYVTNWIHWTDNIPCSAERRFNSGEGQKSAPPILLKRQKHQLQLEPRMHPARSRGTPMLQGTVFVAGENDLSTYNWNSFGLRYGKRQSVKAKEKS